MLAWYKITQKADWRNIQQTRQDFPHADPVTVASGRTTTVFNIKANAYRLVTAIHYNVRKVFVLIFMTHAEYSRGRWKDRL